MGILRPPLTVIVLAFGNLYKLCFGWHEKRVAKRNEQRFAQDIRTCLAFLFTEHGAKIIPNEGVPFPPLFDAALVTLAVGTLRLRFELVPLRGEFGVMVAPDFAPQQWNSLELLADAIGQPDASH
ncbi:MAG: hypothetical protein WCC92_04185, partial [Candidatus Korobacteraceae bacterium]